MWGGGGSHVRNGGSPVAPRHTFSSRRTIFLLTSNKLTSLPIATSSTSLSRGVTRAVNLIRTGVREGASALEGSLMWGLLWGTCGRGCAVAGRLVRHPPVPPQPAQRGQGRGVLEKGWSSSLACDEGPAPCAVRDPLFDRGRWHPSMGRGAGHKDMDNVGRVMQRLGPRCRMGLFRGCCADRTFGQRPASVQRGGGVWCVVLFKVVNLAEGNFAETP